MKKYFFLTFTLFALFLAGCNMPGQIEADQAYIVGGIQPQAWMDAPLNESYLPLDPYEIVYHISDQDGVTMGELSINNQVVESQPNPDTSKKLATLKYLWNPTEPGTYLLSVRAQGADGTWGSEAQSVVFIGEITETITPTLEITLTQTPTLEFTTTPTPTAILAGFTNFSASPGAVHYGNCTPNQVSVSVTAIDPAGITSVVLFYRMRDINGQSTEWLSTAMNPGANDLYSKMIDLTSFESPYPRGELNIQLVIQNKNGDLVRSDGYSEVGISSCFQPLYVLDTPNPQILPMNPTSTPIIIK